MRNVRHRDSYGLGHVNDGIYSSYCLHSDNRHPYCFATCQLCVWQHQEPDLRDFSLFEAALCERLSYA